MSEKTVYLKIAQSTEVNAKKVCLKDIADVSCADKSVEARLKTLCVVTFSGRGRKKQTYAGSVMELIERIEAAAGSVSVNSLGETDFLVTYTEKRTAAAWNWIKAAFVCAAAFCGAAFAIMTFNNDADVKNVFAGIYQVVLGDQPDGPWILEAGYSVGLAAGILLFFNHFAAWKITADPTPVEVEMRLYEENLNKAVIQEKGRKETETDVT